MANYLNKEHFNFGYEKVSPLQSQNHDSFKKHTIIPVPVVKTNDPRMTQYVLGTVDPSI